MLNCIRAALICLIALVSISTQAQERITDFNVQIDVQTNGDFIVSETISVISEGYSIRRGIFRDIPRFQQHGGYKIPQKLIVLDVRRNGNVEPFTTSGAGNALRIKIGDKDVFLKDGQHTYLIRYLAKNQIRYSDKFDEVYWNATGTYWKFPIENAKVTVTLPGGAAITESLAYTGRKGQTGTNYTVSTNGNQAVFQTKQTLQPREGITVTVSTPKGVIDPPSAMDERRFWWVRYGALTTLIVSLFGIFAYYYRAWDKVGRDPVKGPVFARYEPPKGYSPAAVSYINYKGISKNRALIAALLSLAMNKRITIKTDKKKTTLTKLIGQSRAFAAKEEKLLMNKIFTSNKTVRLDRKPNKKFYGAYTSFKSDLTSRFSSEYHRWNGWKIALGILLTVIAVIIAMVFTNGPWTWVYWVLLAGLIILNILFLILLPAPTRKGQDIQTQIDGFKLYLETAEEKQINLAQPGSDTPPPMSVELYEKFLPYAVALGVEKPWTERFESALPAAASDYNPSWGAGHFSSANFSKSMDNMVSTISSGVSSAAPPSSSSSGSGGGGFSGGGGGGGGGGGW